MKALLIYKSEVSDELETVNIKIYEESEAENIIKNLSECYSGHISVVVTIGYDVVRIPVFRCFKEEKRYSVYKLVGIEIK